MRKLSLIIVSLIVCLLCVGVAVAEDDYGYYQMSGRSSGENQTLFTYEGVVDTSTFSFVAPEGYVVVGMDLHVNPGDGCNWTLFSDNYAVEGWWVYNTTGLLGATGSTYIVSVGSDVQSVSCLAPGFHYPESFGVSPGFKYLGTPGDYTTISQGVYTYTPFYTFSNYHDDEERIAYQEVTPLELMRSIKVENYDPPGSEYPVKVYYLAEERALFLMDLHQPGQGWSYDEQYGSDIEDLIDFLYRLAAMGESLYLIMAIFEYIFVEHFFEVIVLYEVILAAYSAHNSREFITFCKKFSKANMALFDFILKIMERIVTIVTRIIEAILPF